jgi:hypothetical protein
MADFGMVLSKRTKPLSVRRTSSGAFLIVQIEKFFIKYCPLAHPLKTHQEQK